MTISRVVLSIPKDNIAWPTLFTTYDTLDEFHGCTIWQVARATSAATSFFEPIKLGSYGIAYIDAGLGYNNPTKVLIKEAQRKFPYSDAMRVLSIGTGLGNIASIGNSWRSVVKVLKKLAVTSDIVAAELDLEYAHTDEYYRFNVDRGLEKVKLSDWQMTDTIITHTKDYLRRNVNYVRKFVDALTSPVPVKNSILTIDNMHSKEGKLQETRPGFLTNEPKHI